MTESGKAAEQLDYWEHFACSKCGARLTPNPSEGGDNSWMHFDGSKDCELRGKFGEYLSKEAIVISAPAVRTAERCPKIELRELAGLIDAVEDVVQSAREHFGIGDPVDTCQLCHLPLSSGEGCHMAVPSDAVPSSPAPSVPNQERDWYLDYQKAVEECVAAVKRAEVAEQERDQLRAWKSSREPLEHDAKRLADLLAEEEDKSASLWAELDGARETAKTMIVAQLEKVAGLRAEVERLRSVILWALGQNGDFPPPPLKPGWKTGKRIARYWWRKELRERAALDSAQPSEKGIE